MFNSERQHKQREMFSDFAQSAKKTSRSRFRFGKITLTLSYENILLLGIGLIMTLIVCYSLGVERGKILVQAQGQALQSKQEEREKQTAPTIKPPPQTEEKRLKVKVARYRDVPNPSAYIQVATFRTDKYAKKEQARLRHKGYPTFIVTKGDYKEVCVGRYKDKEEAIAAMEQLRRLYADCILRQ